MVVAITGASAGIGEALADELAFRGASLALCARRLDRLEQAAQRRQTPHLCLRIDVDNPLDCQAFIEKAQARFGRIDTLVCNAGYGVATAVEQTSDEQLESIFRTNVFGSISPIRAAIPLMLAQEPRNGFRGQLMIVSSAAARRGLPYFGAYAATKAAQLSIAEALRVELRGTGIAVTTVHPIGTETEFFNVAEQAGNKRITVPFRTTLRQSAKGVARAMVKAMCRPRPEVWPAPFSRLALTTAAAFPRITDFFMSRMKRQIDRLNERSPVD
jgi:short-subunit dehydrogenase